MSNLIKKSLRLVQLEKMVIILKEMEHIENILKFYEGHKKEESTKPTKPIKPIKKNIKFLKEDIKNLRSKISTMKKINKELHDRDIGTTNLLFIIEYDYIRTQIEDMLRVIQALYNKMGQLFGEALNQYIPYPILGRRYSNNAMMIYLENYYRNMLDKLSKKGDKPNLILGWNYRTGFLYRTFVNRNIKRDNYNDDTYNNYIDLPYWYYELPYLLPSITHEVVHIALREPNDKLSKMHKSLQKDIEKFFSDNSNHFIQKVQDVIGYDEYIKDLSKEIMCDLYGYKMHKESYIYALFHNVIGEKLAKDYLKVKHTKDGEECEILPNDWYFLQKKDHSILRLHFLLAIDKNNNKPFENMREILNSIMPLNITKKSNSNAVDGFEAIYTYNYPNFKPSYESVQSYLEQLLQCFVKWFKKIDLKFNNIENSPDFNEIWQKRFDKLEEYDNQDIVLHQNYFRREINKKVSKIEYFEGNEDKKLAYLLTLKKIRKDENSIQDYHTNNIVYGIYDDFTLENKENSFNVTNTLELLLKQAEEESTKLRFFNTKHVLTKACDSIDGATSCKTKGFSVIFNIELLKNANKPDGYDNLDGAIKEIAKVLREKNDNFYKADIYISLGPKDITVIVEKSSLQTIFHLTETLNLKEQIMRTFSIIFSKIEEKNSQNKSTKIEDGFRFVSTFRLSEKGQSFIKDYKEFLGNFKEKTDDIVEITGVMDVRIVWKTKDADDIFAFYNKMIENSYVTDCQTRIEKILML